MAGLLGWLVGCPSPYPVRQSVRAGLKVRRLPARFSLYICPSPSWVDSRIVVCDASAVYVKVKGGMSSERVESRELE